MGSHYIYTKTYSSPLGELLMGVYKDQLVLCDWKYRKMRKTIDKRIQSYLSSCYKETSQNDCIDKTIVQLEEYCKNKRQVFDIPIRLIGTEFQISVWKALQNIPYGQTISYLELSQSIQNKGAIRAVGSANGANCISIIIPCHRVVGSNGELTGYAGGLSVKKKLLSIENATRFPIQTSLF